MIKIIAISSGHGLHIRGARGIIDEVDEARRVTNRVAELINANGGTALTFHDNETRLVNTGNAAEDRRRAISANIGAITRWHNSQQRDMDISVHFNAGGGTGVETLYRKGHAGNRQLARDFTRAIAEAAGLDIRNNSNTINGAWGRSDLGFLNQVTTNPTVLLEVAFVDNQRSVDAYLNNFEAVCAAIAETALGRKLEDDVMTQEKFNGLMDAYLRSLGERPPNENIAIAEFEQAKKAGITDGSRPQAFVTRQEAAVMAVRAAQKNK